MQQFRAANKRLHMKTLKTFYILGALLLATTMRGQADMSKVDGNFKVENVEGIGVLYYNALETPFSVEGFAWRKDGEKLYRIPKQNILLSTGTMKQKADMMDAAKMLVGKGYKLFATGGTHKALADNGIESTLVYWPSEPGKPQALEMLHNKEIDMVVNIPKNLSVGELDNGYKIRRAAIDLNIPLITNARLASAFIQAFCTLDIEDIAIKSWDEYK